MLDRRALLALLPAGLALPALSQPAEADLPDRPIRLVVPFAPGGTADLVARILADGLRGTINRQVVVENRPGAGGTIGTDAVARAAPDGTTFGLGSVSTHAIAVSLFRNLSYDPQRDFAPVALLAGVPNAMVVPTSLGVGSVAEFIAAARDRNPEFNFGSIGNGTSQHLGGELFKLVTGIRMQHVPYRQNALLITGLIDNQVQVVFDNVPNVLSAVQGGRLRALAVTVSERWPGLPDVPTMRELGYDAFDNIASWLGVFAPRGMPPRMVATMSDGALRVMRDETVRARLLQAGVAPTPADAAGLASFVDTEVKRWRQVVQASGARVD